VIIGQVLAMRFDWDPVKNELNREKHGVAFEEAVHVFSDRNALSIFDEDNSESEDRWITIGMIPGSRLLVVAHTDRVKNERNIIRIISSRKATRREAEYYFKSTR
jgi:uncharacterized protein